MIRRGFGGRCAQNLPGDHIPGTWKVEIGTAKHKRMEAELEVYAASKRKAQAPAPCRDGLHFLS